MKFTIVLSFFTLLFHSVFAQISVSENQIIQIGQNVVRETDTLPNISGFMDVGTDLYWDYSGHTTHTSATTNAVDPATTPYASDFPNSNICLTADNVNFLYFETSPADFYGVGLAGDPLNSGVSISAELDPPSITYDFPLQYLKNFSGSYVLDAKADGSTISPLVDSVQLVREAEHTDTFEAYGLVETDYGVYKTIKNKRIETGKNTINTKIFGNWSQFDVSYDTSVTYYWHTREGKLPVAEVSTDLQGNIDSTTLIITQAVPEPLANFGFDDGCVGNVVQFTDSSIQNPTSWLWDFGDGNTSTDRNPTHTYTSTGPFTVSLIVNRNYPDTLEKTIEINQVIADAGSDEDICPGESVSLTASGGVDYEWSTGAQVAGITVSPSSNSTYTVTVTDANGCTDTDQVSVSILPEPSAPLFDAVICNGNPVTLDAENPNALSYNWSTGATTQTITTTTAGTYTVTITNNSSCSIVDTAEVTLGSNLSVPLVDVDACVGDTVILNAGNSGATYTWSTGATSRTISVTTNGTYGVIVDDQGCTGSGSSTVAFNVNPEPEILGDSVLCLGESVYLFVNTTDVVQWSNSSSNDSIMVSPSSNMYYSVTQTNNFNCSATDSVLVTVNTLPTASISGDDEICAGENTTLTASGGTDYLWSNTETTAAVQLSPTSNETYTVTVTDNNNCSNTAQETVVVNALPTASINGDTEICAGESATLTATGGASYVWSNTESTPSIQVSPASDETYTVTVTGNNNCSNTAQETVTVNALPNVAFAFGDTVLCLEEVSTLPLNASPAGGTFSGVGVTGAVLDLTVIADSNLNSATVNYTYTGSNNCTVVASVEVTFGACPGIQNLANQMEHEVYPNPSSNGFYVKSSEFLNQEILLTLVDLNGKTHLQTRAEGTQVFINTETLANGLYFLIGRSNTGALMMESKVQVLR